MAAEEYMVIHVRAGFVSGGAWNKTEIDFYKYPDTYAPDQSVLDLIQNLQGQAMNATLEKLEMKSCIQAYSNQFISGRRNLLAEAADTSITNITIEDCPGVDLCPINWMKMRRQNDYCLSEIVPEKCQLQVSVTIMVVVIFCNLAKAISNAFNNIEAEDSSLDNIWRCGVLLP